LGYGVFSGYLWLKGAGFGGFLSSLGFFGGLRLRMTPALIWGFFLNAESPPSRRAFLSIFSSLYLV
jgi:hypothetical protein